MIHARMGLAISKMSGYGKCMSLEYAKLLPTCLKVVKRVGEFQMKHFRAMPTGADQQKAAREMVSFVDVESEKMLMDELLPLVDGAGFYGEESGRSGPQELVWVVDPLDGTTNYLSGLDQFSISIALVANGVVQLGVVHKPSNGETFAGVRGHGVSHNGVSLPQVSATITPQDALFVTGFPYRSPDVFDAFFRCAGEVLTTGRGIRRFASAALDVCNLSAGWVQGYWESDLQAYDVAAGMLFMEQTGCVVTNDRGEPYNMFKDRMLVAALPGVHPTLLELVQKHYGDAFSQ